MDCYDKFLQLHHSQLQRVPRHLWRGLHRKLQTEVYDAGEYFMLSPSRGEWRVLVIHRGRLAADDNNSVFLIDHAWTFQPHLVARQLQSIPGLANRMAELMDLNGFPCMSGEEADSEELSDEEEEEGGEGTDEGRGEREETNKEPPTPTPTSPHQNTHPHPPSLFPLPPLRQKTDQSDTSSSSSSGDDRRQPVKALPAPVKGEPGYDSLSGYESYAGYESCDVEDRETQTEGQQSVIETEAGRVWPELTNGIEVPTEEAPPTEELVARIQEAMWRFCHPYTINNSPVPVWYVMDEFGSRVPHSNEPSVAMTTFFYIPRQLAYCVLWPTRDLKFRDTVTRDHLHGMGITSPLQRACHLLPWSHDSHLTLEDPRWQELPHCIVPPTQERCNESLPDSSVPPPPLPSPTYLVYTDIDLVQSFLTHPSFKFTDKREEAHIIWCHDHFKDFDSLKPECFINQFGYENILTCKDLLVETAKRARCSGTSSQDSAREVGVVKWAGPKWLPMTYNLLYELPHLVQRYRLLEKSGESNVWIVKPWNLGRGMDIHVTSSLHHIIRLAQAGPKIASRYITDPVLFHRPELGLVKFDIRYMILLKSVAPLEAYVYNVFWLRFANKPFSLDNFYDYEKHFTVMNYQKGAELNQVHCDEFISLFEEQYPSHAWADIQDSVHVMLSELMRAACSVPPPAGLAPSAQSRAIYAADLMLEWNRDTPHPRMEPKLLEINFCPDCVRACRYHPEFFNHVFEILFLPLSQQSPDTPTTRLQ